jgi:hypothetical protein
LWIFEGVFDFGLTQKNVSAASAPQHLLERRNALTKNDAGNETKMNTSEKKN